MAERRFRKGDLVKFRFGLDFVQGKVKEDRGAIGVKGRHLYLVEFRLDNYSAEPSLVELPAVDMLSLDEVEPEFTLKQ